MREKEREDGREKRRVAVLPTDLLQNHKTLHTWSKILKNVLMY